MSKTLLETFESHVANAIDEKGVYPHPMMHIDGKDTLVMSMMDVGAEQAIRKFLHEISANSAKEAVLGMDRTTKPGQGTEFADVLTLYYWKDRSKEEGLPEDQKNWSKWFRFGCINYQHEPRIVRPIDWDNKVWIGKCTEEINHFLPAFRIAVKKAGE